MIYMLTMLMPADYIDNQTSAALQSGAMTKEDVQRLKELYGLADKSFTGILKSYASWLKGYFPVIWVVHLCTASLLQKFCPIIYGYHFDCFYIIYLTDHNRNTDGN